MDKKHILKVRYLINKLSEINFFSSQQCLAKRDSFCFSKTTEVLGIPVRKNSRLVITQPWFGRKKMNGSLLNSRSVISQPWFGRKKNELLFFFFCISLACEMAKRFCVLEYLKANLCSLYSLGTHTKSFI